LKLLLCDNLHDMSQFVSVEGLVQAAVYPCHISGQTLWRLWVIIKKGVQQHLKATRAKSQ